MAVVFQMELRQSTRFLSEFSHQHLVEYFNLVRQAISDGKASGEFRRDLPEKIAANCFFGAIDEMVTSWVLSEKDYPLANVADPVLDILLNGMRTATSSPKVSLMEIRTLNDVFFTVVGRDHDRVMLTRHDGDVDPILRAAAAPLGNGNCAPIAGLGNRQGRPGRHSEREPAGMGGDGFCDAAAGRYRCADLRHPDTGTDALHPATHGGTRLRSFRLANSTRRWNRFGRSQSSNASS